MATQAPRADADELGVEPAGEDAHAGGHIQQRQKSLTIGAVCKALAQ